MEKRPHTHTTIANNRILLSEASPLGPPMTSLTMEQFISGFKTLNDQDRPLVSNDLARSFVSQPTFFHDFFSLISSSPSLKEAQFAKTTLSAVRSIEDSINRMTPEETTPLSQDEQKLGQFLDVYSSSSPALSGIDPDVYKNMKRLSKDVLRRTFLNCQTQKDIVDVMYNSATYLLENDSTQNREFLYDILTFSSPFLRPTDIQAGRYIISEISSNEDIFMKYYWLNSTVGALITLIKTEYHRDQFNQKGRKIIENNPGFMEIRRQKDLVLTREQQIIYSTEESETQGANWHEKLKEQKPDDFDTYFDPLTFPYSIATRPNKLMTHTKRLIAEIYKDEMADIVSVVLPHTNTAYNVFVEKSKSEERLEKPKKAMHYVYEKGPGGEVTNPHTIHDALRWFRPELLGTTFIKLEKMTTPKIKKRLAHPKRSLPAGGIHIVFDEQTHPFIEANAIDIDKTGKKIVLTFGAYTIPLCMDNEGHIRAQDGSSLNLEPNSRSWWEATILSTIADITSPIDGDEVLLTDSANMPRDEAMEKTQRAFVLRGPHMRRLHPGQGFDTRRAEQLLLEEWPFPHIQEPIDLFAYNGIPHGDKLNDQNPRIEREEGQWTYVHEAQPKDENERVELKQKKRVNLSATATSLPEIQNEIQTQYTH